jgi:hypothetical protein
MVMVFQATTSGPRVDLVPLSISISLIFGLTALRNVQLGVPPVGALGDYVSFSGQKLQWVCRPSLSYGRGCCAHMKRHS